MMDPRDYSVEETLKNGRKALIRALRPEDREDFLAAINELDDRSMYLRFFYPKKKFSDAEVSAAIEVDFVRTVALIACITDSGSQKIIGGCRYVVFGKEDPPARAEVAFTVVNGYQGLGIGGRMLRHLAIIAKERGIREFYAEVMSNNTGMLTVFRRSGFPMDLAYEYGVAHVRLALAGK